MTWVYVPETEFPSALGAGGLNLVCTLPSRTSLAAALLSGSPTPKPRSSLVCWETVCPVHLNMAPALTAWDWESHQADMPRLSNRPQCGQMCEPSSVMNGAGISTSSVRDTLASRSAPPESVLAAMIRDTSGPTLPASSGKQGPNGGSSKTSAAISPLALKPCCETYGTWVGRLRLAYSHRKKLAIRTKGKESSFWPTAQARDFRSGDLINSTRHARKIAQGRTQDLNYVAEQWPTPMSGTPEGKKVTVGLENQATIWGTPKGSDGIKGGPNMSYGAGGTPLPAQAANWPTPQAHQDTKGDTAQVSSRQAKNKQIGLAHIAREHQRPVHQTAPRGVTSSQWRPISRRLLRSAILSVEHKTLRRWLRRGAWRKRRLNPIFVEWLMHWPSGHGLCGSTETELTHWLQDMRGELSALPTASAPWIWQPPTEHETAKQMDLFG